MSEYGTKCQFFEQGGVSGFGTKSRISNMKIKNTSISDSCKGVGNKNCWFQNTVLGSGSDQQVEIPEPVSRLSTYLERQSSTNEGSKFNKDQKTHNKDPYH